MQFFARSFSIFILISPIIRAKHHTAVRCDCLHGMPRFHITFANIAISWLRPITCLKYAITNHYPMEGLLPMQDVQTAVRSAL